MRLWYKKKVKTQKALDKRITKDGTLKHVILLDDTFDMTHVKRMENVLIKTKNALTNMHHIEECTKVVCEGGAEFQNFVNYDPSLPDVPGVFDIKVNLIDKMDANLHVSGMIRNNKLVSLTIPKYMTLSYMIVMTHSDEATVANISGQGSLEIITRAPEVFFRNITCSSHTLHSR